MDWSEELAHDLDTALNEATVQGITWDADTRTARMFLDQDTQAGVGPLDSDMRWVLVAHDVGELAIALSTGDSTSEQEHLIELTGFDELEKWFATFAMSQGMYGWSFFDTDWPSRFPASASLVVPARPSATQHRLRWFCETGIGTTEDGYSPYIVEGWLSFADLTVERAGGQQVPLETFTTLAKNRWTAVFARTNVMVGPDVNRRSWRRRYGLIGGPLDTAT